MNSLIGVVLEKVDWTSFLNCERGLLIAPAGHGKTTAIADCLLQCPEGSCHLVLTHTHAGIASLRMKFKEKNVPTNRYQLETITGFAQQYVLSFIGNSQLPQEDNKEYFPRVVELCTSILDSKVVQIILKASYKSVFVDEYQDCSYNQHQLILQIGKNMPVHLLGDPLQGIFSFEKTPMVNLDADLNGFVRFNLLAHPWRWDKTNRSLGDKILSMRKNLENHMPIDLTKMEGEGLYVEYYNPILNIYDQNFLKTLRKIVKIHMSESFLVIYPSYHEKNKYGYDNLRGILRDRIELKSVIDFGNYNFKLLDAIDAKVFYSSASKIDEFINKCQQGRRIAKIKWMYEIMETLHFSKTELKLWFNPDKNSLKKKQKDKAIKGKQLKTLVECYDNSPCLQSFMDVLNFVYELTASKCQHKDIYYEIKHTYQIAMSEKISMLEAMRQRKNQIRHMGKRVEGHCIGTTLLTKGLEFDTVVLYKADKFEDAKNFYVAISRARKKLILITSKSVIHFH